jgi:hypothetical protein
VLLVYGCVAAGEEEEDGCEVGTEGCECTRGGGCDPWLACLSGFCVDAGGVAGAGGMAGPSSGPGPSTGGTGGAGASSAAATGGTTNASSSAATTTSSAGGSACAVPDPTNVMGCDSCEACDNWTVSWDPVAGATHYKVAFTCLGSHESPNILDTNAELCFEVGMCSWCSGGVSAMSVKACDATCCSAGAIVPVSGVPLGCQVDCCV